LRWNHAGLIGGRAFADLLKWNKTLVSLELAGNEVPDDIMRAICASLATNNDKRSHAAYTRAHAESMSSTIQTLSTAHNEALLNLQDKLSKENNHGKSLMEKLSVATLEIENTQEAYKIACARVDRLEKELEKTEKVLIRERSEFQQQMGLVQTDLINERKKRGVQDKIHEEFIMNSNAEYLKLNKKTKELELDVEILQKDKKALLCQLDEFKERENKLNALWNERINAEEESWKKKIFTLQDKHEKESSLNEKRFHEKICKLESLNQELDRVN
jgi:chromosome segregation ATPase